MALTAVPGRRLRLGPLFQIALPGSGGASARPPGERPERQAGRAGTRDPRLVVCRQAPGLVDGPAGDPGVPRGMWRTRLPGHEPSGRPQRRQRPQLHVRRRQQRPAAADQPLPARPAGPPGPRWCPHREPPEDRGLSGWLCRHPWQEVRGLQPRGLVGLLRVLDHLNPRPRGRASAASLVEVPRVTCDPGALQDGTLGTFPGLSEACLQVPLAAYEWLVCYLLRESHQKLSREKRSGKSDFEAINDCQVYHCRPLALAFLELTVVRRFHEHTHQPRVPPPLRAVLRRLSALYALWSLSQHTALLYRGGYFSGERAGKVLESAILALCAQLKDDAVALVDVIAPPDFILDSPIGRADGELYKNLWTAVLQENKVLERASWWAEFAVNKPVIGSLKPKL